jgi:hypothetical protein
VFTTATVLKPSLERVALLQKVGLTLAHVDAPCWFGVRRAPLQGLGFCQ